MTEHNSWYVAVAGKQEGPMTLEDVRQRIRGGRLARTDHVFAAGMASWVAAGTRPELAGEFTGAAPPPPPPGTSAHEIDYEIFGEEMQYVEVALDPGEACVAEAGAFLFMEPGIEMETIFGDGSSPQQAGLMGMLMSAGKRVLTGESLFMTVFGNQDSMRRKVAFASPYPGRIVPLDLRQLGGTILCQKDSFLCAAKGISVGIAFQRKLGVGLFGGEGFILQKLQGDGLAFVHAGGAILERQLAAGETLRLDTGCLVALEPQVQYEVQMVKGIKTALFGGEGLFFASLTGPGRVWIQSLPFSRLASRIFAAAPQAGGGRREEGSILGGLGNLLDGD